MIPLDEFDPAKHADKALSLGREFRDFAFKANVVDLAVGVIIGAAFGKLVESLVKHVLMPAISVLLPTDQGYTTWKLPIRGKEILIGQFLGELVNFLIVAAVLWIISAKFLGWLRARRREQAAAAAAAAPTKQEELLTEIRDLLRQQARPPRTE